MNDHDRKLAAQLQAQLVKVLSPYVGELGTQRTKQAIEDTVQSAINDIANQVVEAPPVVEVVEAPERPGTYEILLHGAGPRTDAIFRGLSDPGPPKQPADPARLLARLLHEEFDKESWGDIDPYWVEMVANGLDEPEDPDDCDPDAVEEAKNLKKVLDRVVSRLDELRLKEGK